MSGQYANEPMLDMYIFETTQNIEQLENLILDSEKSSCYTQSAINEIFRIMHTIKGSSAMMLFDNISDIAHKLEDLFYFLREQKSQNIDFTTLSDLVFEGADFIKVELLKIKNKEKSNGDASKLIGKIKKFLDTLKEQNPSSIDIQKVVSNREVQYYISSDSTHSSRMYNYYKARVFFDPGCEMENIRAYTIVHNLKEFSDQLNWIPKDILDNDESVNFIREHGFAVFIKTGKSYEELNEFFMHTAFLKDLELVQLENEEEFKGFGNLDQDIDNGDIKVPQAQADNNKEQIESHNITQSIISVNIAKLDKLMDLVGEMVIAEAMVTQNPDLKGLQLKNFQKAARQLHKITTELQDLVMSIRMVPLSTTFQKMHRIVRDMSKKLDKEVQLELVGEETEVDKNIIEHISDPLMHLVRNSIDHGIESAMDRESAGKPRAGRVVLEARNAGSEVLITVKDDGKGLSKEKILERARKNNLLLKPEKDMNDREIYNLIFLPGFSTKDAVSEFSGRGVGMDVVTKNIESVGGSVSVDSIEGEGSTIILKIPLTLAIIDGMNVQVGNSCYTIPTMAIRESFRPKETDLIKDPDGNEMVMVRGQCYPVLRLHQFYKVKTEKHNFIEGIFIMVEQEDKALCIFADELLGQQQVVVKTLPTYIKNTREIRGISGCTLLGNGCISLILDIGGLMNSK